MRVPYLRVLHLRVESPKCESHHRTGRGKYADEICSDCDHDECEMAAKRMGQEVLFPAGETP